MAIKLKQEFLSGPGSIEDVIKIDPNAANIDPDKTSGREHRGLLFDFVDTLFGLFERLTGNDIRGVDKKVRNLTRRDAIPARFLVAGDRCAVTNNTDQATEDTNVDAGPAEYFLLRDSTGPLTCFIDGDKTTTQTVRARWVRSDGSFNDRIGSYPALALEDDNHEIGDIVRWTFVSGPYIGKTRLFQVLVPLHGQYNPEPTGDTNDPNYFPFSPIEPAIHVPQLNVVLTFSQLNNLRQDEQYVPGTQYTVTNRSILNFPLGDVVVTAISSTQVAGDDAYLVEYDQGAQTRTPVIYNDVTDQTQPRTIPSPVQDSLFGNATALAPSVRAVNERFGRFASAVIGSTNQLFATYEAAENVLNDGDTVYLYGYHAGIAVDKGLNIQGTANIGSVTIGYLDPNGFSATFGPNLTLEGRNVVCGPTTAGQTYNILFNGCKTGPNAFFEQYSYFTPAAVADMTVVTLENIDLYNTEQYFPPNNANRGGGCIRYQEHGYDGHARWIVSNSKLRSLNNSVFTGYPHGDSRAELTGTTIVTPGAGRPLTALQILNGPNQPESVFVIDNRAAAGPYATLDGNGHVLRSQMPPLNWQATIVKVVDEGLPTEHTADDPAALAASVVAWFQGLPGYANNNTVSLRGNFTWAATGTTPPTNTAPYASSVAIAGSPVVGLDLVGSYTYNDAEGDAEAASLLQWYLALDAQGVYKVAINGATSATYTVQPGDVGKFIIFAVTAKAATGDANGAQVFSSATAAVTAPASAPVDMDKDFDQETNGSHTNNTYQGTDPAQGWKGVINLRIPAGQYGLFRMALTSAQVSAKIILDRNLDQPQGGSYENDFAIWGEYGGIYTTNHSANTGHSIGTGAGVLVQLRQGNPDGTDTGTLFSEVSSDNGATWTLADSQPTDGKDLYFKLFGDAYQVAANLTYTGAV
jgi:hypothetical protein